MLSETMSFRDTPLIAEYDHGEPVIRSIAIR